MLRRIMPYILLLVAMLLDTAILPVLTDSPLVPVLTLVSVIALGLLMGRTRGALYGIIGGLLTDVLVGYPLGLRTLLYLGCGYASGVAGRKFQRYAITPVVTPILCLAAYEGAMITYMYMLGQTIPWLFLRNALIRAGLETLLAQLLYLLFDKILKPSWSRYAAR